VTIIGRCEPHNFTLRDGDRSPTMAGKQAEPAHRRAATRKVRMVRILPGAPTF
jgi:hypothetical protein